MIRPLLVCAAFAVVLTTGPVPVLLLAQEEAFVLGIRARERQQWDVVIDKMREAINADRTESPRKLGSSWLLKRAGEEYRPYYFLGDALFKRGDCAAALPNWEESEQQGLRLGRHPHAADIKQGYEACELKGFLLAAKLRQAEEAARAAISDARAASRTLLEQADQHPEVWAEFRERREPAEEDLAAADQKLKQGQRTRFGKDLADALDRATRAHRVLRDTRTDLLARVTALARVRESADKAVESAEKLSKETEATLVAAAAAATMTIPENVREDHQRGRRILEDARRKRLERDLSGAAKLAEDASALFKGIRAQMDTKKGEVLDAIRGRGSDAFRVAEARVASIRRLSDERRPSPEVVAQISRDLAAAEKKLRSSRSLFNRALADADLKAAQQTAEVPRAVLDELDKLGSLVGSSEGSVAGFGIPESLRTGAEHYFGARYQEALNTLTAEVAASAEPPLKPHVHVLRAAALFALYEHSGRTNESFRDQARAEADTCRRLDQAFEPILAAFSPRFISFFHGRDATARR